MRLMIAVVATFALALGIGVGLRLLDTGTGGTAFAGGAPLVSALEKPGSVDTTGPLAFAAEWLAEGEKLRPVGNSDGMSWYLANGRLGELCLIRVRNEADGGLACWAEQDLASGFMWQRIMVDGEHIAPIVVPDGYSIRKAGSKSVEGIDVVSKNLAIATVPEGGAFELAAPTRSPITLEIKAPRLP